jgi:hypothetical protein
MNLLLHFTLLFSFIIQPNSEVKPKQFDRDLFYKSIISNDLNLVEKQLECLNILTSPDKEALQGALLMRKSGLLMDKKEKLDLFKKGRSLLESSILKNSENCEYHFLRLIIQENAPKVLGYNKNINEDCKIIQNCYKNTPEILKKNIIDFSKNSLNLRIRVNE